MSQTRPDEPSLLLPLVLHRVLLLAWIGLVALHLGPAFQHGTRAKNFAWPEGLSDWRLLFTTWDANHYFFLADQGYSSGSISNAFYPLWPALLRVAGAVTDPIVGGIALANVLAVAGCVLLHRAIATSRDRALADDALVALLAWPSAFYLGLPYSEALFLALTGGFFLALAQRRPWMAGAIAFWMPLARAPGHFAVLVLAAWIVEDARRHGRTPAETVRALAACALPVLGSCTYFASMWWLLGSPFTGFDVQGGFIATPSVAYLFDPVGTVQRFADIDLSPHNQFLHGVHDRVAFVAVVALLPVVWRMDRVWALWTVLMGVVPAILSGFMSAFRYELLAWPALVAGASLIAGDGNKLWRPLAVATLVGLQMLYALLHVLNFWVA